MEEVSNRFEALTDANDEDVQTTYDALVDICSHAAERKGVSSGLPRPARNSSKNVTKPNYATVITVMTTTSCAEGKQQKKSNCLWQQIEKIIRKDYVQQQSRLHGAMINEKSTPSLTQEIL